MIRETFKFWDLVCLIWEVVQYQNIAFLHRKCLYQPQAEQLSPIKTQQYHTTAHKDGILLMFEVDHIITLIQKDTTYPKWPHGELWDISCMCKYLWEYWTLNQCQDAYLILKQGPGHVIMRQDLNVLADFTFPSLSSFLHPIIFPSWHFPHPTPYPHHSP